MTTDLQWARTTADPLADDTMAAIIGSWPEGQTHLDADALARIALVNHLMGTWGNNASLSPWLAPQGIDPQVASALESYVHAGCSLPAWAKSEQVELAEQVFMDDGPLSCTMLFCASLPQCYVLPNLADVLHIAGQLEAHTEHRIRQTAAMIFPVMMRGGLMGASGYGLAQVLKVRLIHATIRHLILRGHPQRIKGIVPAAITTAQDSASVPSMHSALMRHGWNVPQQGMPCNQIQLAYTLLTFSYVFLKGLRTLHQALSPEQELAYLHTWNVMGHVLGIRSELMAHNMQEAQLLFERIQAQARHEPAQPDTRPALGKALMNAMARSMALPVIRHLPLPLTQRLIGLASATDIGLGQPAPWLTRLLFAVLTAAVRATDSLGRIFIPDFSISRMITRILGYHLLTRLMLSQTRPLALPQAVLADLHRMMGQWGNDPKALDCLNRLEDRWTVQGAWVSIHPVNPPAPPK
jgi:ER-bound oxygenase mpaB/B'/Rubber oxygenase, catalytic domain